MSIYSENNIKLSNYLHYRNQVPFIRQEKAIIDCNYTSSNQGEYDALVNLIFDNPYITRIKIVWHDFVKLKVLEKLVIAFHKFFDRKRKLKKLTLVLSAFKPYPAFEMHSNLKNVFSIPTERISLQIKFRKEFLCFETFFKLLPVPDQSIQDFQISMEQTGQIKPLDISFLFSYLQQVLAKNDIYRLSIRVKVSQVIYQHFNQFFSLLSQQKCLKDVEFDICQLCNHEQYVQSLDIPLFSQKPFIALIKQNEKQWRDSFFLSTSGKKLSYSNQSNALSRCTTSKNSLSSASCPSDFGFSNSKSISTSNHSSNRASSSNYSSLQSRQNSNQKGNEIVEITNAEYYANLSQEKNPQQLQKYSSLQVDNLNRVDYNYQLSLQSQSQPSFEWQNEESDSTIPERKSINDYKSANKNKRSSTYLSQRESTYLLSQQSSIVLINIDEEDEEIQMKKEAEKVKESSNTKSLSHRLKEVNERYKIFVSSQNEKTQETNQKIKHDDEKTTGEEGQQEIDPIMYNFNTLRLGSIGKINSNLQYRDVFYNVQFLSLKDIEFDLVELLTNVTSLSCLKIKTCVINISKNFAPTFTPSLEELELIQDGSNAKQSGKLSQVIAQMKNIKKLKYNSISNCEELIKISEGLKVLESLSLKIDIKKGENTYKSMKQTYWNLNRLKSLREIDFQINDNNFDFSLLFSFIKQQKTLEIIKLDFSMNKQYMGLMKQFSTAMCSNKLLSTLYTKLTGFNRADQEIINLICALNRHLPFLTEIDLGLLNLPTFKQNHLLSQITSILCYEKYIRDEMLFNSLHIIWDLFMDE